MYKEKNKAISIRLENKYILFFTIGMKKYRAMDKALPNNRLIKIHWGCLCNRIPAIHRESKKANRK